MEVSAAMPESVIGASTFGGGAAAGAGFATGGVAFGGRLMACFFSSLLCLRSDVRAETIAINCIVQLSFSH